MAQINVVPIVLKDVRFRVDADNYEKHVSKVTLTPNTSTESKTWQGLTPTATFTDTSTPQTTWTAEIEYAQDWETVNSLSSYLLANAGVQKSIKLQPQAGAGKSTFTITATIVPGPIGGQVNEFATSTVSLPCTGQPVKAADGVA
jgi:hypothetical protein